MLKQEEEKYRNRRMSDIIYVNRNHRLAEQIFALYHMCSQLPFEERFICIPIDANLRSVCLMLFLLLFYLYPLL